MCSPKTTAPQSRGRVWRLFVVVSPAIESALAAAACASATHASVAGAAAGHDGSAGGAGGGVAHVDDVLHGVGGVVDAAIFEGRDGGVQAAAGAQVGGDSLLGWGGGVGVLVAVIPNSR